MTPWNLYNLTPRDQGSPLIRPFHVTQDTTVVNPGVLASQVVLIPNDQVLLLTMVSGWIDMVAPNIAQSIQFQIADTVGSTHVSAEVASGSLANQDLFGYTWTGSPIALVNDQQQINIFGRAISSTNPWLFRSSVSGVLIPRGTISLT